MKSLVSLAVVEGIVVSHSGISRVLCFYLWTFHPKLTLDGFKDVLDWELLVSILSVSYLMEKNTGSGRGVTSFRDQAQTCI